MWGQLGVPQTAPHPHWALALSAVPYILIHLRPQQMES